MTILVKRVYVVGNPLLTLLIALRIKTLVTCFASNSLADKQSGTNILGHP